MTCLIIDKELLKSSDEIYVKNSIYNNVVNYLSVNSNHLISIVNNYICMGPSRIKINKQINFKEFQDYIPNSIQLKDILNQNVIQWWESKKIKTRNKVFDHNLYKKISTCIFYEKKHLFCESQINQILFDMIDDAFNQYEKTNQISSFKQIIGLGPGLTPLGDDVIVGMLLCKNALDYDKESNLKLLRYSNKTSVISYNFLKHACENNFSDDFYKFYEMSFINQNYDEKIVNKVLDFGSSSGFGIIYGFWKYLSIYMKTEANNE